MLKWNSQEVRELRDVVYQSYTPKNFTGSGRWFFWATFLMTVISEVGISYAVSKQSAMLGILMIFITGIVFYRYQFILHECSHSTLVAERAENKLYGDIAGFIAGYPFAIYKRNHAQHHLYTGTSKDSELSNFIQAQNCRGSRKQFLVKLFQSLLLVDAFILIRNLFKSDSQTNTNKKNISLVDPFKNILFFSLSIIFQCVLLNVFNNEKSIIYFLEAGLLFVVSVGSVTFALNRIRGLCEHSIVDVLEKYNYTRSHQKGIINVILAPYNFNYHFEHHIFPEISSGNYEKINQLMGKIFTDSNWVSSGYLSTIKKYLKNV